MWVATKTWAGHIPTITTPLAEFYKLQTKGQKKYLYNGKWIDFKTRKAKLKIKLGGLKLAVSKKLYDSEFGPVFKTKHGMYASGFPPIWISGRLSSGWGQ